MSTIQKVVNWSEPFSPNAQRFSFAREGCYTLSTHTFEDDGHVRTRAISGHATEAEALRAANQPTK